MGCTVDKELGPALSCQLVGGWQIVQEVELRADGSGLTNLVIAETADMAVLERF